MSKILIDSLNLTPTGSGLRRSPQHTTLPRPNHRPNQSSIPCQQRTHCPQRVDPPIRIAGPQMTFAVATTSATSNTILIASAAPTARADGLAPLRPLPRPAPLMLRRYRRRPPPRLLARRPRLTLHQTRRPPPSRRGPQAPTQRVAGLAALRRCCQHWHPRRPSEERLTERERMGLESGRFTKQFIWSTRKRLSLTTRS